MILWKVKIAVLGSSTIGELGGRIPIKQYVTEYILQRIKDVKNNPDLLTSDRKNVNRVYYTLRKKFLADGWRFDMEADPKQRRHSNIIAAIKDVCDELGLRRSDIGIVTDNVGYLYFKGEQYSVGIDQLKGLVQKGTDIVIVEKQDIALSLSPYAAPYGVALLSTRGFLTENAHDLQALAEKEGANIAILTDYDVSGAVIAAKVPKVPRLGIDMMTLRMLDLKDRQQELEEEYTPNLKHFKHVLDNPDDFTDLYSDLDYLRSKRIELDSVIEEVGNARFWGWLSGRLEEEFPNRDYNRAVGYPTLDDLRPEELQEFNVLIDELILKTLNSEIKSRTEKLKDHEGFIDDVPGYEEKMVNDFNDILNGSADYKEVKKITKAFLEKYKNKK